MERKSIVRDKSFEFSLTIIDLYMNLKKNNEEEIATQLIRLGTSIGVNVEESFAISAKKEIGEKLLLAGKEARETLFWLRLLESSEHFKMELKQPIKDCEELIRLLKGMLKTPRTIVINNKDRIKDN